MNFDKVYSEFHSLITNYVNSKVYSRQDAEELVQDVFVKVAKHLDSFDSSKSSFKTWMFNITNRVVYDYWRKNAENTNRGKFKVSSLDSTIGEESHTFYDITPSTVRNPHMVMVNKEMGERVRKSFRTLRNRKIRRVANLFFNHELKLSEIVERTGYKLNTVKVYIHSARETLQAELT